jgi:hypothetical protein
MEKDALLRLLANNELETLFAALQQQFPNQEGELALLEGQWNELRAKVRVGVLTQEQTATREPQIRSNLKDFIEQGDTLKPSGRTSSMWWVVAAILALALA